MTFLLSQDSSLDDGNGFHSKGCLVTGILSFDESLNLLLSLIYSRLKVGYKIKFTVSIVPMYLPPMK